MKILTSLSILLSIAFASSAHALKIKMGSIKILSKPPKAVHSVIGNVAKTIHDAIEKTAKATQDASETAKVTGETLKYTGEL